MIKLSTGDDATLGNYRKLAAKHFGENSGAVRYLDQQILKAKHGEDEEVLADERQVIQLLMDANTRDPEDHETTRE